MSIPVSTLTALSLVYNRCHVYPWVNGRLAHCGLRVYKTAGRAVVIASEVEVYPRSADTTRTVAMAMWVYRRFGLPLDDTVWIVHTPGRGSHIRPYPNVPEQFEEVAFAWTMDGLGSPQWTRRHREEVEELIGQPL